MADEKEAIDPNEDPHIFGQPATEDDGTADMIRKLVDDMNADDGDDDGGFDQPMSDRESELPDVVGPDEGHDLLDKTKDIKTEAKDESAKDESAKPDEEPKPENQDEKAAKPDDDAEKETKEATTDEAKEVPDLKAAAVSDLLEGVADDRRSEISRRLGEASQIMDVFKDHSAELERHSTTPKAAMNRLIELNSFAQKNPDEYLAWVSRETGGDNPAKALEGAAKLLGYKMVKDVPETPEVDEYATDRERELIEENARLKAAQQQPQRDFGPDTPDRQQVRSVQDTLQNFVGETDESGSLKRPHWELLAPQIGQMASRMATEVGRPLNTNDLQTIYDQAVSQARSAFVPAGEQPAPAEQGGNTAAQAAQAVTDTIARKAAAATKAQRASKNIDGTGQGAPRRPALSQDASLDAVIRHYASAQQEN